MAGSGLYRSPHPSRQITSILAIATGALIIDNFRFDFAMVVARWDGRQQQAFCGAVRNVRPLLIATTFFACLGVAWNLLATIIVAIALVVQGSARGTDGSSVAWLALGVLLDVCDAAIAVVLLSHINAWTVRFGAALDAVIVPAQSHLPPVTIVVHPAPLLPLSDSSHAQAPLTAEYIVEAPVAAAAHSTGTTGAAGGSTSNGVHGKLSPNPQQPELPAAGIHLLTTEDAEAHKPIQQLPTPPGGTESETQATWSASICSHGGGPPADQRASLASQAHAL